jgi:hypothetical protein
MTWTDTFTTNVTPTTTQMNAWSTFTASLSPRAYSKVIIKGTFDTAGQVCTDTAIVNALANSLFTNTDYIASSPCNGNIWHNCASHGYMGEVWLNPPSACSGANCPTGYIIRPKIGNSNWGGVNTNTCSAPTQRMTLIFEYTFISGLSTHDLDAAGISFDVFPNPFANSFTVSLDAVTPGIELSVCNLLGETVFSQPVERSETTVDTEKLPAGIYFITLKTAEGSVTKKMVKE